MNVHFAKELRRSLIAQRGFWELPIQRTTPTKAMNTLKLVPYVVGLINIE